jgi:hypothetical protein
MGLGSRRVTTLGLGVPLGRGDLRITMGRGLRVTTLRRSLWVPLGRWRVARSKVALINWISHDLSLSLFLYLLTY